MARRTLVVSRAASNAATLLGAQVEEARKSRRWTRAEFAERVGVSEPTIRRLENGDPTVALGTALEAAVVAGVEVFGVEPTELGPVAARARERLALLPTRVRARTGDLIDDDF